MQQGNQRWRLRKALFRRPEGQIRAADYDVAPIPDDRTASTFVRAHHYAGTYPAARWRFGLYHRGDLAGVAVFSHPVNDRTLTNVLGGRATDGVELGRFILLDNVPGNGETWFLARCLAPLRKLGLRGVVSFSDPVPRTTLAGAVVFPGHVGTIYQAGNAACVGRGSPALLAVLADGTVLSPRCLSKVRNKESGGRYAAARLVAFGADALGEGECPRAWVARWLPRLTRPLRHPGNHKYAWSFHKSVRLTLLDYPKRVA